MNLIKTFFSDISTRIKIAWIKYWALQRRFVFDGKGVPFYRVLIYFVAGILLLYFVVGLPFFSYMIYKRHSEGVILKTAALMYPLPIAMVGGDVILLKPFADRLSYLQFFSKQTGQSVPSGDTLRGQVVDKLIDESVARQWANKDGIKVTSADIDATYQKIISEKGNEGNVQAVLSQLYNLSDSEFKRVIPDYLYRQKIEEQLLERVHVRHILVTSESTANKVKAEATPENFGEKAKQYSEDKTTRDAAGELGFFDRAKAEKILPDIAKTLFEQPVGQVAGPFKSQYGYHIVLIVEKTGKEPKSFSAWLEEKRNQTKIRKFL